MTAKEAFRVSTPLLFGQVSALGQKQSFHKRTANDRNGVGSCLGLLTERQQFAQFERGE
jgi:hypothetical protein